jgi:hypothetical protein
MGQQNDPSFRSERTVHAHAWIHVCVTHTHRALVRAQLDFTAGRTVMRTTMYEWPSEVRLNLRYPQQAALFSAIQRFLTICVRHTKPFRNAAKTTKNVFIFRISRSRIKIQYSCTLPLLLGSNFFVMNRFTVGSYMYHGAHYTYNRHGAARTRFRSRSANLKKLIKYSKINH